MLADYSDATITGPTDIRVEASSLETRICGLESHLASYLSKLASIGMISDEDADAGMQHLGALRNVVEHAGCEVRNVFKGEMRKAVNF